MTKAAPHILSPCRSDMALFDDPGQISAAAIAPPAVEEAPDWYNASCKRCVPRTPMSHGADASDPQAASAPPLRSSDPKERRQLLARLRRKIRELEGNVASWLAQPVTQAAEAPGAWTLGEPAFDACLPGGRLDPAGLIELKPASHSDWPVALTFAACLAVRRQLVESGHRKAFAPVLWCATSYFHAEHGRPYGPGLMELGLSPESLLLVDAPREADALWVLEEGVRSKTLSLVIGLFSEVDLTPSRRLGLAALAGGTPALLLTSPSSPPAPSASLRLRLQRAPSSPHPLDIQAPGTARMRLALERCRGAPAMVETRSFDLEWCNVTYRFRMAADVADRAYRTPQAGQRA